MIYYLLKNVHGQVEKAEWALFLCNGGPFLFLAIQKLRYGFSWMLRLRVHPFLAVFAVAGFTAVESVGNVVTVVVEWCGVGAVWRFGRGRRRAAGGQVLVGRGRQSAV